MTAEIPPAPAAPGPEPAPPAPAPEHFVLARALLPLRLFLGVTYLYAGIDKFTNAHFFAAGDPFSVAAQMEGYARLSPLAGLIAAAAPIAIPIGLLIALAELAIGLGVLTGLAYRVAAWTGFAISMLFWLTASWSSTPYFFSPDLPYAVGFLTLALAGHGGLYVLNPFSRRRARVTGAVADAAPVEEPVSAGRRTVLQMGVLGGLTVAAAALVSSWRLFGASQANAVTAAKPTAVAASTSPTAMPSTPSPTGTPAPTEAAAATTAPATAAPATAAPTAAPTDAPTAAAGAQGPVIGTVTDLGPSKAMPFTVPNQVPFAMGPGGPGIMVELSDGRIVAYSATCPHGRCTVGYDPSVSELVCPCHLGRFDPANQAAVLGGPPPAPLPSIPLAVDGAGQIHVVLSA